MAEDRILTSYYFDGDKNEVHVKKISGDTIVSDKVAAKYDPEAQKLVFANQNGLRLYKVGVLTFLAEQEMLVKIFERADLGPDKPLEKTVPGRPKKNKAEGDKTPAVVDWYRRYKPNEFKVRYGVMGNYSGPVLYLEPIWEPRPVDRVMEFRGEGKVEGNVSNVLVATRAVCGINGERLTYTPDECLNWDEDEPEEGDNSGTVGRRNEEDET